MTFAELCTQQEAGERNSNAKIQILQKAHLALQAAIQETRDDDDDDDEESEEGEAEDDDDDDDDRDTEDDGDEADAEVGETSADRVRRTQRNLNRAKS
jgi:hypothetical protein